MERFFKLNERGTNDNTEFIGGILRFIAMLLLTH